MGDIDINAVLNTLVGKYVITNGQYVVALEDSRDTTLERFKLSGVIEGLRIALVALGQDIEKIDSQFNINGI